jgi:hypothetical protein
MGKKGNRIRKRHRKMIEARKVNLEHPGEFNAARHAHKTPEWHALSHGLERRP